MTEASRARRPSRLATSWLTLVFGGLVTGGLLTACGYEAGYPLLAEGIHTVAIDVAGNQTYRQGLEIQLTRELYEALPRHTNLQVSSARSADARLVVEIADAQGRLLVPGSAAPIKEGAIDLVVTVRLIRNRDGAMLRERRVVDRAEFRIPVGENLATATRESAYDLARKIVLSLEPDF